MIVELTAAEQGLAQALTQERMANARAYGRANARQCDMDDTQMNLDGIGAELAFCKLMNVYPDTSSATSAEDCHLLDGRRVDVKTTRHERGHLLAVRWKKPGAVDLYVLMIGTFPRYRCAGWLPEEELVRHENLRDLGRGLVYAAHQDELRHVEELLGD